jgi:hypothetical protein
MTMEAMIDQEGRDSDGGSVMKIESKACASVSCVIASGSDGVRIYSMSIRDRGKMGASMVVFVGQHGDDEGGNGKSRRQGIDGGTVM